MALCLANSLVVRRDFIPYDQLVRYKWWYRFGYMSSTGKCFDIGKATKESLEEFECRQKKFLLKHKISPDAIDYLSNPHLLRQFDVNCSRSGVAGNGALMRLAPVPLFFYRYPQHAVEFSGISGEITHGDRIAYDACRYYGALIAAALQGENKKKLLASSFYSDHKEWFNNEQLHPSIMEIVGGSYRKHGGHSEGIRGKGYIVRSLEKGVLDAVNLGDDTDTTAAIYGQLAGAYYGYQKLPEKWRDAVYAKKFIECLSRWIVYEGERWQPENQQNSKASFAKGPGSEGVPQSVQDNHSKSKSNPTASSQYPSHTKGVSTWDESPDQNMSSTSPKSTQPKSSNPTASSQQPSYVKNGSNRNDSPDRHVSPTSPKPTQPSDPKTAFRGK
jgi:ADP-ribosylglycohydrolase